MNNVQELFQRRRPGSWLEIWVPGSRIIFFSISKLLDRAVVAPSGKSTSIFQTLNICTSTEVCTLMNDLLVNTWIQVSIVFTADYLRKVPRIGKGYYYKQCYWSCSLLITIQKLKDYNYQPTMGQFEANDSTSVVMGHEFEIFDPYLPIHWCSR